MKDGFITVAAGTPRIRVADCRYNAEQIFTLMREADKQGVKVLALPELCLTGYTCGDLFLQETLLNGAEEGLRTILEATKHLDLIAAVGLPVRDRWHNKLYNCAAVIQKGEILGLVPKTHVPNYGEFYEQRWFASAEGPDELEDEFELCGQSVCLNRSSVFACASVPDLVIGVEICEDLWAPEPPSTSLARRGATLILNLSASNETVGKAAYRRSLVTGQSGRLVCGYVYADAGEGESTTDLVFAGHNLIAENGTILAERRFATGLTISEIDVAKLAAERRRMNTFTFPGGGPDVWRMSFDLPVTKTRLTRHVSPTPFVPEDAESREARCSEILCIAALGLKKRLEHTGARTAVVGLSGGLDSTLAVLITALAMQMLDRPATDIIAVTMPCFGTTDRTKSNAVLLAERLGTTLRTVDISASVRSHFKDIGHDPEDHSVTYENAQARERTQVLMDIANANGGLVIGAGPGLVHLQRRPHEQLRRQRRHPQDVGAASGQLHLRRQGGGGPPAVHGPDGHSGHPRVPGAAARRPGGDQPKDRGPGGALRAPRLLPVLYHPLGLQSPEGAAAGGAGLCRQIRPAGAAQVAAELLPPLLLPAVQAQLSGRRPQGGLRGPQPPRRLADAQRRGGSTVAGGAGGIGLSKTIPPPVAISGPPQNRRVCGERRSKGADGVFAGGGNRGKQTLLRRGGCPATRWQHCGRRSWRGWMKQKPSPASRQPGAPAKSESLWGAERGNVCILSYQKGESRL